MSCWGYDSFGNRTLAALFSSTTGDCSQQTTPTATYSAANAGYTFVGQSAPITYSAPSGFRLGEGFATVPNKILFSLPCLCDTLNVP